MDPDPLYSAYVDRLGPSNFSVKEPIQDAIGALPNNFGALLMTTRSALPADHAADSKTSARYPSSLTAAEFRILRESFGLSAEWLAEHLRVALKTVQRWENGHRPIPEGIAAEMSMTVYATYHVAARMCAEHLLETPDAVMTIPRTGTYLGFPASWYRALVDVVRRYLVEVHGDEGAHVMDFRVVYVDEIGDHK